MPFCVQGDKISTGDLALAPKLYHMKVALGELKASIPTHFRTCRIPTH